MLMSFGYKVLTASDGDEALKIFRRERKQIALVLTDTVMPKMGGEKLCARVARIAPTTRLILTSGHSPEENAPKLRVSGAHAFLKKPFTLAELGRTVREVLDTGPSESPLAPCAAPNCSD
jgi:DNA-binding NtrC family response regulator